MVAPYVLVAIRVALGRLVTDAMYRRDTSSAFDFMWRVRHFRGAHFRGEILCPPMLHAHAVIHCNRIAEGSTHIAVPYLSMARVPPALSVLLSRVADSYSVRQSFSEDPLFPSEILVRKVAHSLLY